MTSRPWSWDFNINKNKIILVFNVKVTISSRPHWKREQNHEIRLSLLAIRAPAINNAGFEIYMCYKLRKENPRVLDLNSSVCKENTCFVPKQLSKFDFIKQKLIVLLHDTCANHND